MSETNALTEPTTDRSFGRLDWVRTGLRIAAMSSRRQIRRLLASPRSSAVKLLAYVGVWVWLRKPWQGRTPGEMPVSNVPAGVELMPLYRAGITGLWVLTFVIGVVGATRSLDDLDVDTAVVRVAGVRATLLGRLVYEHARRLAFVGVIAVIELVSMVVGGGSSLTFALGLIALIGLEVTAGLAGEALALAYTSVSKRKLVGEYVPFAVAGLWIAAVAVVTKWPKSVIDLVAGSPTGWFADLLFLGTPGVDADPRFAAGAAAFSTVGTAVLFLVDERLAGRVWFDPTGRNDEGADEAAAAGDLTGTRLPTTSRLPRSLADRVPTSAAARAVAWRVTTRTVRRPSVLYLLSFPAIFALGLVLSDHGHVWYPFALAMSGAWAAGTGVTLNPLSSEGVGLPGLLTAPVSARDLLTGYVATGVAFAAPLVVLPSLGVSLFHGVSLVATAQAIVLGFVCSVAGATVAFAIGIGLPTLGAMSASEADAPMPPTQVTIFLYTLAFGLIVAPATVGLFVEKLPVSVDPTVAAVAGLAGTAILGVAASAAAARYARRRLDGFELAA